ncbi:hypothetical protein GCM10028803_00550 [Larkinella knui]|uniref:Uncharacterized protein n=1 Tax=Larkinella knui TaxID=2025310 RepID=A0A3P1CJM7_9BACT|nr:hypothetical protein [Larkinella knui]RRB13459.1 hypothetical protein EHT87_14380 [Larkinella knui]
MSTIKERVEKALPLAKKYVEAELRITAIDQERSAMSRPRNVFTTLDEIEMAEKKQLEFDAIDAALKNERDQLKEFISIQESWREGSLSRMLNGSLDETEFEVIVTAGEVKYNVAYADDGLYFYEITSLANDQTEVKLQVKRPSRSSLTWGARKGCEALEQAKEAYEAMWGHNSWTSAEIIALAQVIETAHLESAVAACAPA